MLFKIYYLSLYYILSFSYINNNIIFSFPEDIQKNYIKYEVIKYCNHYKKYYPDNVYNTITNAIIIGQKHYPHINYKYILSFISIESRWDIYAKNKNKNNTFDYGLTQQNSKYLRNRYKVAQKLCDHYKVKYIKSNYDITLNILSAYIYFNEIKQNIHNNKQQIIAYNTGIKGSYKYQNNFDKNLYYINFLNAFNL